ncbi:MAG TPA: hypothetical protein ENJ32_12660 [Crenotrichaceae bacterium]|nr:hypothetical protein [Crenotrichaceae bacterium]
MANYYVATIYKQDDILLISEDGDNFYHFADKRTYSDLGIYPNYHYKESRLKGIRPATNKDFEFFRVKPPENLIFS